MHVGVHAEIYYCFHTGYHNSVDVTVPLFINEYSSPYCELSLSSTVSFGTISVRPSHVVIPPIPLGVLMSTSFVVVIDGVSRYVSNSVS